MQRLRLTHIAKHQLLTGSGATKCAPTRQGLLKIGFEGEDKNRYFVSSVFGRPLGIKASKLIGKIPQGIQIIIGQLWDFDKTKVLNKKWQLAAFSLQQPN